MFDKIKNKYRVWNINRLQRKIDDDFMSNGFSVDLLERQVEVNAMRQKFDIADDSEKVYEEFVQ